MSIYTLFRLRATYPRMIQIWNSDIYYKCQNILGILFKVFQKLGSWNQTTFLIIAVSYEIIHI